MDMPEGLVTKLGDKGSDDSGSESTDDESMLEQHLKAFKRGLDSGNMSAAANSFKAAMDECSSSEDESPSEDASEPGESDEY